MHHESIVDYMILISIRFASLSLDETSFFFLIYVYLLESNKIDLLRMCYVV